MPSSEIDAFDAEICSILDALAHLPGKTLRDDTIRDRVRTLYRVWMSSIRTVLQDHARPQRDVFKIDKDLELAAKSASKIKPIATYREHLRNSSNRIKQLAIYVPLHKPLGIPVAPSVGAPRFVDAIPDIPLDLIPNPIVGWKENMQTFLSAHPFNKTVFVMIRYRRRTTSLIERIRAALNERGLTAILANEHSITDDLYNPVACLMCCGAGIAVFDQAEVGQVFNPNVAYELGMFHLLGRPLLILKHNSLKSLHTDILSKLYQNYTKPDNLKSLTLKWVDDTLLNSSH